MAPPDEWTGRTIDGRYVVEAMLGSGGMGVVLRARHQFTGAYVALKMLRSHLQLDQSVQARFLAEARAPTAIGHRGIVQVLDAGRTPEGELYLAMELLQGVSMRDAVRAGLAGAEIKRIVVELLDALAAAHHRGVVHRDLKPENVFLAGPDRSVKLLDFGIAKIVASDPNHLNQTAAGALLGTLAYMAPEQIRDASTVDPRADLWAVGVMIYEMLARRLPYRATDLHALFVQISTQPPDPIETVVPGIPPPIAQFFARALARDPAQRFASAQELAQAVIALPIDHNSAHAFGGAARSGGAGPFDRRPEAPPPQLATGATQATGGSFVSSVAYAATSASGPGMPVPPALAPSSIVPIAAHPPATAPGAPRSMWPFALLGIAVVAGIVIIVVATRGDSATALATANPPTPTPTPTPAPAPGPDPWKDPVAAPAPGPSPLEQQCIANCRATAACNLPPGPPTCEAQCTSVPAFANCMTMTSPLDACAHAGSCLFLAPCHVVPHGTNSCRATAICQSNCAPTNFNCGCACMEQMAPVHAAALARLDACALACGGNSQCITTNCTPYGTACGGQ